MANYSMYSDGTQMPRSDEKRFFLRFGSKSFGLLEFSKALFRKTFIFAIFF